MGIRTSKASSSTSSTVRPASEGAPTDFVFASQTGTGLQHRNVAPSGLEPALRRAGLGGSDKPRFRFHDCRHSFASLLIAEGLDVVFVSRQLGHANRSITLSVYSHLFDRQRHADRTRDALEGGVRNDRGTERRRRTATGGEGRGRRSGVSTGNRGCRRLAATPPAEFTRGRSLVQSQPRPLNLAVRKRQTASSC
jgi:hypothetical protein